tara:strand:- start:610 stop:795 length:186 start_codon:yes stop_codon:yes gene_type:complete
MNKIKKLAIMIFALAFIFLLNWASNAEYDDALMQQHEYINNVCMQVWPDYKNLKPSCEEIK